MLRRNKMVGQEGHIDNTDAREWKGLKNKYMLCTFFERNK